jgi:hypothetical protein
MHNNIIFVRWNGVILWHATRKLLHDICNQSEANDDTLITGIENKSENRPSRRQMLFLEMISDNCQMTIGFYHYVLHVHVIIMQQIVPCLIIIGTNIKHKLLSSTVNAIHIAPLWCYFVDLHCLMFGCRVVIRSVTTFHCYRLWTGIEKWPMYYKELLTF